MNSSGRIPRPDWMQHLMLHSTKQHVRAQRFYKANGDGIMHAATHPLLHEIFIRYANLLICPPHWFGRRLTSQSTTYWPWHDQAKVVLAVKRAPYPPCNLIGCVGGS